MNETAPQQLETAAGEVTDETAGGVTVIASATRGMRREDIDLASLNLPFADPPDLAPPPPPET